AEGGDLRGRAHLPSVDTSARDGQGVSAGDDPRSLGCPRRRAVSGGEGPRPCGAAPSAVLDGLFQLVLGHARAALDALALGVLVELVLGASLRTGAGALAPALGGRLVLEGGAAGLL